MRSASSPRFFSKPWTKPAAIFFTKPQSIVSRGAPEASAMEAPAASPASSASTASSSPVLSAWGASREDLGSKSLAGNTAPAPFVCSPAQRCDASSAAAATACTAEVSGAGESCTTAAPTMGTGSLRLINDTSSTSFTTTAHIGNPSFSLIKFRQRYINTVWSLVAALLPDIIAMMLVLSVTENLWAWVKGSPALGVQFFAKGRSKRMGFWVSAMPSVSLEMQFTSSLHVGSSPSGSASGGVSIRTACKRAPTGSADLGDSW
mmetsp:Transcript_22724/g.65386  ORF Transcript_22724/g.65386 Transcript_22724/m.65386 type:complete len:262 (-) Transcript_22724:115-900(-)